MWDCIRIEQRNLNKREEKLRNAVMGIKVEETVKEAPVPMKEKEVYI